MILFYQRLKKQEEQIDLQRKQRTDDRFTTAVELLGSSETSARTGAIYSLYHLAIEDKKYRIEVSQDPLLAYPLQNQRTRLQRRTQRQTI